jgi:hypothetical protein
MALKKEFTALDTGAVSTNAYHKISAITIRNMRADIMIDVYFDEQSRQNHLAPITRDVINGVELADIESQTGDNIVAKSYEFVKANLEKYAEAEAV